MPEIKHRYEGDDRSVAENLYVQLSQGVTEQRDFGVQDSKGRKIGGLVTRMTVTTVAITSQHDPKDRKNVRYAIDPGTYYLYEPSATRNGAMFGASQTTRWFSTEAEREDAVEKYFREAYKRAVRGAAKAP